MKSLNRRAVGLVLLLGLVGVRITVVVYVVFNGVYGGIAGDAHAILDAVLIGVLLYSIHGLRQRRKKVLGFLGYLPRSKFCLASRFS